MRQDVIDLAQGRWPSILTHLGIAEGFLRNRHSPCPHCQGKDRYRFDDKDGRGTYYCNVCGPGDGPDLLMRVHGWDFAVMAREVKQVIGACPVSEIKEEYKDPEKIKFNIQRYWKEANQQNIVTDYLKSRGLSVIPKTLRGHPALGYLGEETGELTKKPAMVALVTSPEGKVTTMHRTFLLGEGKRDKKLYKVIPSTWLGGAIRLFPEHDGHIALSEGIETALAVHEFTKTHIPAWATVCAKGMEAWAPPEGVKRVSIFADNDANFTGQKAAYTLANKLALKGIEADVWTPKEKGSDWLNVFTRGQG